MSHNPTLTAEAASGASAVRTRQLAAIFAFAILTAIGARLSVPLPGTPVPFTLQPVAVLLSGLLLGSALGATSQLAYLALGAAGLPVFAAGGGLAYLGGPTGGYLLAFPLAAGIAGAIAGHDRGVVRVVLGGVAGLFVIHLSGATWLSLQPWFSGGSVAAFELSFMPFLVGDILKVALVALIAIGVGRRVRRLLG